MTGGGNTSHCLDNYVSCATTGCHGVPACTIALSIVSSLRIAATSATFGALPAAHKRWENTRITGFHRVATNAAMYRTGRKDARPPQIVRCPRRRPLSRLKGARPPRPHAASG